MRIVRIAQTPEPANPLEVSPGRLRARWSWDCHRCRNRMWLGPNGLPLKEIEDSDGRVRFYQSDDDECPHCMAKDYRSSSALGPERMELRRRRILDNPYRTEYRLRGDPIREHYPITWPKTRMPPVRPPLRDVPSKFVEVMA